MQVGPPQIHATCGRYQTLLQLRISLQAADHGYPLQTLLQACSHKQGAGRRSTINFFPSEDPTGIRSRLPRRAIFRWVANITLLPRTQFRMLRRPRQGFKFL